MFIYLFDVPSSFYFSYQYVVQKKSLKNAKFPTINKNGSSEDVEKLFIELNNIVPRDTFLGTVLASGMFFVVFMYHMQRTGGPKGSFSPPVGIFL